MDDTDLIAELVHRNIDWEESFLEDHPSYFDTIANQQHPIGLIITCADSRIPFTQITESKPVIL